MRRKKKLSFSSERQEKAKKMRSFIISFAAFVVVLGSISLLMFFKSINFDTSNLFNKKEAITDSSTTQPVAAVEDLTGKSNFMLACYDTENKLSFLFFIKFDMDNKTISVLNLPSDLIADSNNISMSMNEHYAKNGVSGLKSAVSNYTRSEVNKYIKVSEANLKKIIDKIGAVDVNISSPINYKSNDFNLSLNSGKQSLSGDMLVKYLKITKNEENSTAFANFLKMLLANKTIEEQDSLFYEFINLIDTDISVVDYSNKRNVILSFSNLPSENKTIKSVSDIQN